MIPIVTRSAWGTHYGTGSLDPGPESNVVIHHSYRPALRQNDTPVTEAAAWRGIEVYHVETNGWDGIGYNFGVAPSGRIYEGRGWRYRGAHAGPINSDSIGICLLIDGNVTDPNPELIEAVRELIELGVRLGEIKQNYRLSGHRDHMQGRSCPGDKVYKRLDEFRHDFRAPVLVPPGTRVWSNSEKEHLIVTKLVTDLEWYYVRESALMKVRSSRASTPFSKMPSAKW